MKSIPFIRTSFNIYNTKLPEYVAMVVFGKSITVEQAAEVIIRTDKLNCWERNQGLRNDGISYIPLTYLYNEWITSDFVLGPHGWCDWKGNIGCHYGNIGHNSTVELVEYEWKLLAYHFHFLELRCQLFDREVSDVGRKPIVEYEVNNGQVTTLFPVQCLPHTIWGAKYRTVKEMCETYPVNDRYKGYSDLSQLEEAYKVCLRKRIGKETNG
jgi:hypothetical protein